MTPSSAPHHHSLCALALQHRGVPKKMARMVLYNMALGKDETYRLVEQLLWIIEDYFVLASTPKTYGTDTLYHRLDIHLIDTIGKNEGSNVTKIARIHKITKSAVDPRR